MRPPAYPFAAVVGQEEMKLALLLSAVDWRLGVLLRGDKGSGKTTAARGLAALLPDPAPFINLPIGVTEDRLLGGLNIEQAIKGDPILKRGLLSEAHGGVLYIDEVNLLPAHLGDALLDAAASGIHTIEREGQSASHPAEFVLLGSMNPEEGSLRPQLLDRFALAVTVSAPRTPVERQVVMERRIAFEREPALFLAEWTPEAEAIRAKIARARSTLKEVRCSTEMLNYISTLVCERNIHSLRADLSVLRAAIAYAALEGDPAVQPHHVDLVFPLVSEHRSRDKRRTSPPPPPPPGTSPKKDEPTHQQASAVAERIFAPRAVDALSLQPPIDGRADNANGATEQNHRGPIIASRRSSQPTEFDLRGTLVSALQETGSAHARVSDLHEQVREPGNGTRYLFVIDSSGSYAIRERMRLVKGAAIAILERSFQRGDEVAIIVFRGTSAEVVLEPTPNLDDAATVLEYLPTGGRTPLAHGLALGKDYATPRTLLVVMTDGRANYPLHDGDPWQDAMDVARTITCPVYVIDTNPSVESSSQLSILASALHARVVTLEESATPRLSLGGFETE